MAPDTPPPEEDNPIQQQYERGFNNSASIRSAEEHPESSVTGDSSEGASFRFNPHGDNEINSKHSAGNNQTTAENTQGSGLIGRGNDGRKSRRFLGLPRKLANREKIAGILIGGMLGCGGLFSVASIVTTAQPTQLSGILSRSLDKNNSDTSIRTGDLLRWGRVAKTGDISESRLNKLGSVYYGRTIKQLADVGITYDKGRVGQRTRTNYDMRKLRQKFPQINKMNNAAKRDLLAEIYNSNSGSDGFKVSPKDFKGSGNSFSLDVAKVSIADTRFLTNSDISLLNNGKTLSGIKLHFTTKALGESSLLHPLERAKDALAKKTVNGSGKSPAQQAEDAERQAQNNLAKTASLDQGAAAKQEAADKIKGLTAKLTKGATVQGAVCILRGLSGTVIAVDRSRDVLPAMAIGLHATAVGAQEDTNQDFTSNQIGGVVANYTDKLGHTVWESKPLAALAGDKTDNLTDVDPGVKSAFGSQKVAQAIDDLSTKVLGGEQKADFFCSGPVLIVEGSVIITGAALSEYLSGGLATPGLVALFAANQAKSAAVSIIGVKLLYSLVLNKSTVDALSNDAARGVSGGALMSYGMRAAANDEAINSGGVAISNSESTRFALNDNAQQKAAFRSKNLFARMFDINDYQSLTGKLAESISPNMVQDLASMTSGFKHMGINLGSIFSSLIPNAAADSTYDWGFPQYGLPQELLDDSNLADPYANADAVAKILDSQCRDGNTVKDCDIRTRTMECFGDDFVISTDSDGTNPVWDVKASQPQGGIDPNSSSYAAGHCNDLGDEAWRRIIMFVFDTFAMKGAACYEGDAQSCTDMGMTTAVDTGSATSSGGGQYKIGSFNVRGENHFPGGGSAANASSRMQKAADAIKSAGYDVVGVQEMQDTDGQRSSFIKNLGSDYAIFPAAGARDTNHDTENSIVWNTTKFGVKPVDSGTSKGKYFGGSTLDIPYVELEDQVTHQKFYVSNTHDPADTHGRSASYREVDVGVHLADAQKWTSSGVPVIMTGDFNWGYNIRDGGPTSDNYYVNGDNTKLPYCLITKDGILSDAQDVSKGKSGVCPSNTKQINGPGARTVDHILVSAALRVTNFDVFTNAAINSVTDHPGIVTGTVVIPGSSDSTSSTAGGESFNIATYNLLDAEAHAGDSNTVGGCKNGSTDKNCVATRTARQAKIITGAGGNPAFDVFGTEETSPSQYAELKKDLPNYNVFPSDSSGLANNKDGETAIWYSSGFSLVDSGKAPALSNTNSSVNSPWVELESPGGRKFFVTAIHYANTQFGGSAAEHKKAADFTLSWVSSHLASGAPVFVVGDFNEHFEKGTVPKNTVPDAAYCAFTAPISDGKGSVATPAPLQNIYDAAAGTPPIKQCPTKTNPGPSYDNAGKDQLYYTPQSGLSVSGWTQPTYGGLYAQASDHTPVYATVLFGGTPVGGSDTVADTYGPACTGGGGSTYGVACSGECVDYVEYMLDKKDNKPGKYTRFGSGSAVVGDLISRYGFKADNSPQVGDVVSWPAGGVPGAHGDANNSAGHVAIVIAVHSNGDIVVAEYNYENNGPITVSGSSFDTATVPAVVANNTSMTYAHTGITFN